MGTNQSHDSVVSDRHVLSHDYHSRQLDGNKKTKAKPSPPQRPRINHVTHETVSLSWQPPRQVGAMQAVLAYTVEVCSARDRHWTVLTKSCQSSTYEARYLKPSTEYMFRIRAENLYGVGKPSVPSEPATTKEYDTETDLTIGMSQPLESHPITHDSKPQRDYSRENSTGPGPSTLQRRHSFNVHLDGRISSILKDSDSVLNKSAPASTLQRNRAGSEGVQTLTRANLTRSSLSSSRKVSLPILLPGTGTNSLNRLRESRNSLKSSTSDNLISAGAREAARSKLRESRSSLGSSVSDVTSSLAPSDDVRKRDSRSSNNSDATLSRDGGSSDNSRDEGLYDCSTGSYSTLCNNNYNNNNNMDKSSDHTNEHGSSTLVSDNVLEDRLTAITDETDDISQFKENLKNLELTEEKLKFHDLANRLRISDSSFSQSDAQKGYYESLENPWERDTLQQDPQRIMTAPFCDDIKMALYAKAVHEDYSGCLTNHSHEPEKEGGDFRTLQRVLQSSSMIVRASRTSATDIVGVVMEDDGQAHLMRRGPLTTILDEEEEDPVRVTTL